MKKAIFASLLILGTFTFARADDLNINAYCEAATSVIPEAIKARKAGTPEAVFMAAQGANANDDIAIALVHVAYQWSDMPPKELRTNAIKACESTNGWANCKPLTPETGLECVPPD